MASLPWRAPLIPVLLAALVAGPASAQAKCRFLMPLGGSGEPVVSKRIGPDRALGRTNWNTDFVVDRDYRSYRFFSPPPPPSGPASRSPAS